MSDVDILAKLTIIFSLVGAIAGLISAFMPNPLLALLIAIILLYASYKLTSDYLRKSSEKTQIEGKKISMKNFWLLLATLVIKEKPEEKEKEVRFFFWSYFIMWLILWVMIYTILLLW